YARPRSGQARRARAEERAVLRAARRVFGVGWPAAKAAFVLAPVVPARRWWRPRFQRDFQPRAGTLPRVTLADERPARACRSRAAQARRRIGPAPARRAPAAVRWSGA